MTIKNAIKKVTTKTYIVTKNGEIVNLNGKINRVYEENETVKKIEIINTVFDNTPVITAIRI